MRTTIDLDEGVLAAAKAIARDSGVSLGEAVSRLALRGLTSTAPIDDLDGFPTFDASDGAQPITLELVNEYRD